MSKKSKITAIVQARTSSSRLPGKVLKEILGKPMILLELERLQRSTQIDEIMLATSTDESDALLAETVRNAGYPVYQGNLDDVLDRYYQCARLSKPSHVVRITGDCPLIDPQVVDAVIGKHLREDNDYTSNVLGETTFPDGLDTEVMKFTVLEQAWKDARLISEREHLTQYIIKHPELFKQGAIRCDSGNFGAERWTVDEPEDFAFICAIYKKLYLSNPAFLMEDVLSLLQKHPELRKMNQGFERNEGLMKSIKEDKIVKGEC